MKFIVESSYRVREANAQYIHASLKGRQIEWTVLATSNWRNGVNKGTEVPDDQATTVKILVQEPGGLSFEAYCPYKAGSTADFWADHMGTKNPLEWVGQKFMATMTNNANPGGIIKFYTPRGKR